MLTIFHRSIIRFKGQILGWGLSLAALGAFLLSFYKVLSEQQAQLTQLIQTYPPELFVFFGDMTKLFTGAGFLNTEFFSYMPLILGIFSVMTSAALLAGDEESGILDLILAYPVSRTGLFFGRLCAYMTATAAILALTWLGFILVQPSSGLDLTWAELALPFLSLFGLLMIFSGISLLLSMVLPSSRLAAMVSGLLLVASYFISSMSKLDKNLEQIAKISPMNYYQGGMAANGMEWRWLAYLLALAALFILIAWWRFERRDIRVGGEGGWNLSGWIFSKKEKKVSSG